MDHKQNNAKLINVKTYFVTGCKVTKSRIFNGYVINVNHEDITKSIARKMGTQKLLCETTWEGFDYHQVSPYSIPLTELTLGDLLLFNGIVL